MSDPGAVRAHLAAVLAGSEAARSLEGQVDDLDTAYDLQDAFFAQGEPTCGWKIALNAPGQAEQLGIAGPLVGRIMGASPLDSGDTISRADFRTMALEPEFVLILGRDILELPSRETLPDYIASVHVGFEILDLRGMGPVMHPPTFAAHNAFNARVVVGDAFPLDDLDTDYAASLEVDGDTLLSGSKTAPQHPLDAARIILSHALSRGGTVSAGMALLCGTHHPPVPLQAASVARFTVSGSVVSLSISD